MMPLAAVLTALVGACTATASCTSDCAVDAGPVCAPPVRKNLVTLGDSITACIGQTCNASSTVDGPYPNWMAVRTGLALTNRGHSADMAADMASLTHAETVTGGAVYTVMIGTNDHTIHCSDAAQFAVFKDAVRAELMWLALPDTAKVKGIVHSANTDRVATETGDWTAPGAYNVGEYLRATSGSKTATVNGTTVYVEGLYQISTPTTYQVSIDGLDAGVYATEAAGNANFTTVNGRAYAPRGLRFPGRAPGDHTVTVAIVQADTENAVFFDWAGGNGWLDQCARPTVLVSTVLPKTAAWYADGGCPNSALGDYNNTIKDLAAGLKADGADVRVVDAYSAFVNDAGTAALGSLMYDAVHPNAAGHQVLTDLFMKALGTPP